MRNGRALNDANLLTRFFVLSFADLKCHSYYYWFAFPCPLTPALELLTSPIKLKEMPNSGTYVEAICVLPAHAQNFFILHVNEQAKVCEALSLSDALGKFDEQQAQHYIYCFADPSEYENPAWLMRNYVALLFQKW